MKNGLSIYSSSDESRIIFVTAEYVKFIRYIYFRHDKSIRITAYRDFFAFPNFYPII